MVMLNEHQMEQADKTEKIQTLQQQVDEFEVLLKCGICMDNNRDTVIMPCMHFMFCHGCLTKAPKTCPACRGPISGLLQCKLK